MNMSSEYRRGPLRWSSRQRAFSGQTSDAITRRSRRPSVRTSRCASSCHGAAGAAGSCSSPLTWRADKRVEDSERSREDEERLMQSERRAPPSGACHLENTSQRSSRCGFEASEASRSRAELSAAVGVDLPQRPADEFEVFQRCQLVVNIGSSETHAIIRLRRQVLQSIVAQTPTPSGDRVAGRPGPHATVRGLPPRWGRAARKTRRFGLVRSSARRKPVKRWSNPQQLERGDGLTASKRSIRGALAMRPKVFRRGDRCLSQMLNFRRGCGISPHDGVQGITLLVEGSRL